MNCTYLGHRQDSHSHVFIVLNSPKPPILIDGFEGLPCLSLNYDGLGTCRICNNDCWTKTLFLMRRAPGINPAMWLWDHRRLYRSEEAVSTTAAPYRMHIEEIRSLHSIRSMAAAKLSIQRRGLDSDSPRVGQKHDYTFFSLY